MKTLATIQKTCKVFKILSQVAMIISFVACGFTLLGLICFLIYKDSMDIQSLTAILEIPKMQSSNQIIAALLSDAVFALTDALLFLCACQYFKAEQADGTPFTLQGANRIKRLGIQTIVLPIVAVVIASVVYTCFGLDSSSVDQSNAADVTLGVMLILVSLVFRYGADLEAQSQYKG